MKQQNQISFEPHTSYIADSRASSPSFGHSPRIELLWILKHLYSPQEVFQFVQVLFRIAPHMLSMRRIFPALESNLDMQKLDNQSLSWTGLTNVNVLLLT